MNDHKTYNVSFRCYYDSENGSQYSNHYQPLAIKDIPKWIDAYRFTHPSCISITTKVWFTEPPAAD